MKSTDETCQKCREAVNLDAVDGAMQEHLAGCSGCRAYASQVRAVTDSLRRLSMLPIQPTANFHQRWIAAIEDSGEPSSAAPSLGYFTQLVRRFAQQNRWALPTLAPLWVLILLFQATAPDAAALPPRTLARSPVEVLRALQSENRMQMALDRLPDPPKDPAVSPRGNRAVSQRMT